MLFANDGAALNAKYGIRISGVKINAPTQVTPNNKVLDFFIEAK